MKYIEELMEGNDVSTDYSTAEIMDMRAWFISTLLSNKYSTTPREE